MVQSAEAQRERITSAVVSFADLAYDHDLAISHGPSPRLGQLAPARAAGGTLPSGLQMGTVETESQGMTGFWFVEALENALPAARSSASSASHSWTAMTRHSGTR